MICAFSLYHKTPRNMKKTMYGFLLCCLLTGFQTKAQQQPLIQTADSMFSSLNKEGRFNGNVLLAENGKVLYKKSFGLANEQTKALLNENSVFELASCSKQFTALAIALLQADGELSVDDDFTKYIPELKQYKGITIRNLLYHTSGLPDYMRLDDSIWKAWPDEKIATNKDVIDIFVKHRPVLEFKPGEKFAYSNTGYLLLASIIERASGKSYGAYLEQKIFKPLKMEHSLVYNRRYKPRKVDNYAYGYVLNDSLNKMVLPDSFLPTRYVYNLDGIVGDGAVNSTVNDLLKWDQALYTDKLLPEAKRNELFATSKLNNGEPSTYAFGWMVREKPDGEKIVSHSGGWPGYVTYIERNLKTHRTIIMLQNTSEAKLPTVELRLLMQGKPLPPAEQYKEIEVPENVLAFYTGQYKLDTDFILTITKEGGKLFAQATGQGRLPIYASAEDKFFNKQVEVSMEFVKEGDKVKEMVFKQGGAVIHAPKIN
jgi:CubicO group peptidase (beta-lactamase class C family)